ncbi:hypothetical protein C9I92_16245 [Photobacterium ganghwense]|uniref:Membrane protein n=1 Tax=Photobacterium ganghwense TaxID=320778 RepID=A0A0J1H9V3_9GAMM|nr:hypothetical protein [Photobacterium ganghwense]KLV08461.1 membrane protein [Photobacterium ganghwense]PSU07587.1 hypothetical protein C9I92_16245 [Photobacterium ganghwense]QSV16010.1 hypothetical protein FH974_22500 [Photobacterium ganghwense]
MEVLAEVLGWTSVAFYISLTIFNSMKATRFAAFASAANDIIWSVLMGWHAKVILNLSVASINAYRYAKDFMNVPKSWLAALGAAMAAGIGYILYFAVTAFIAEPSLAVAFQFADLAVILAAIYMTTLRKYRVLMLISGFVGMVGYYGNPQMMIIKAMVIGIMSYKLIKNPEESQSAPAETTQA